MRDLVENGNTSPQTRLIAIKSKPSNRIPRLGRTSAMMSGMTSRSCSRQRNGRVERYGCLMSPTDAKLT